ncbi:MAG: hypothetical protein OEY36_07800 [Gammaproteobacteria bacterium]|nr:hypothetical protein [Gammaproteobacteria bacterium]
MFLWKYGFITCVFFLASTLAQAADPSKDWKTLTSEHFRVHFQSAYTEQAKTSVLIAEKLFPVLQKRFTTTPQEKISMLITDEHDSANGLATPFPFNLVVLRLSPPDSVAQLEDYDDWLSLLIEHELTHIFHLDKSAGVVSRLRKIFGRHPLLFPNSFQPRWLTEGLATHIETHEGVGRGQSSSFEMMMREEVSKGILPVATVNLPPQSYPLNRHYLYGVYFYQFLNDTYGEEKIADLIHQYSDNLLPFAINTNSRRVFGKKIAELWGDFSVYLNNRFTPQLKQLTASGLTQATVLDQTPYRLGSLELFSDGGLLYLANNLESESALIKINGSEKKILTKTESVAEFDVGKNDIVYLSMLDICDEFNEYYDLYRFDINTEKLTKLTECQRYKFFSVSKQSNEIAAVKTIAAVPQIDLLDASGRFLKTLWQGRYGDVVNKIDWSDKRGRLLVTKKSLNTSWNIFELDLKSAEWTAVINDAAVSMQAKYSASEEAVVYSSDASGVFNVYRHTLDGHQTEVLTNVISGAFSPLQSSSDDLYYFSYQRDGFLLHKKTVELATVPQLREIKAPAIRYTDNMLATLPEYEIEDYSPYRDLKPRYWFPRFALNDEAVEFGFLTSSQDSLGSHYYELGLAYGLDQEALLGTLFYQYSNWFGLLYSKENQIYLDASATTTELVRTSQQWQAVFTLPFTKLNSAWRLRLGLVSDQASDSYTLDNTFASPDQKDGVTGLSLSFNNSQYFLKSNSAETGRDVLLTSESSDQFSDDYSGQLTTLDWKEYFRLGRHQTLAIRAVAGHADTTMRPYDLGGLVSSFDPAVLINAAVSAPVFNKRRFALRGYAESIQTGNNLQLTSVEWRFPLSYVEKGIMAPPVAVMKHSARLFTEAGSSWTDYQDKQRLSSAGAEWLLETNILYNLNLLFRFGFARGFDAGGEDVFYLELGGAF